MFAKRLVQRLKAGSHYTVNLLRPAIDGCGIEHFPIFTATCDALALCDSALPLIGIFSSFTAKHCANCMVTAELL